jgi:hypothetical protein
MPLDIQNDFDIFDGAEVVTLIQAGTGKRQVIREALQFGITSRDAVGSDGTYQHGDLKFNLPSKQCPVFNPSAGDWILQEDKTLWSIGAVEVLTLKTRNQCWCKRVSFRPELVQCLKIFKPTYKKDGTGAVEPKFRLWKESKGHVNQLASEIELTDGQRKLKTTHQIYLEEAIKVDAGMKIVDANGNAWHVNRTTSTGMMGAAVTLDVIKTRTPVTDG